MLGLRLDQRRELCVDRNPRTVHGQHTASASGTVEHCDLGTGAHAHLGQPPTNCRITAHSRDVDRTGHFAHSRAHTSTVAPRELGNPNWGPEDHCEPQTTSVPTRWAAAACRMCPAAMRSNTTSGRRLSRHRLMAVASATFRSCERTSEWLRVS